MDFHETYLKDAYVINLDPHVDMRGSFVRLFCKDEFKAIGFKKKFVQINYVVNKHKQTFRGFHFQLPPYAETKLIRCVQGKVQDYIIDIREGSPTFLKSFTIELSENNLQMLLIPKGFAHGYITLEDNSTLIYFHTALYKPGYESGLRYNDTSLNIGLPAEPEIISERDLLWPLINESMFNGIQIKESKRKFIQFPGLKSHIENDKHHSHN